MLRERKARGLLFVNSHCDERAAVPILPDPPKARGYLGLPPEPLPIESACFRLLLLVTDSLERSWRTPLSEVESLAAE